MPPTLAQQAVPLPVYIRPVYRPRPQGSLSKRRLSRAYAEGSEGGRRASSSGSNSCGSSGSGKGSSLEQELQQAQELIAAHRHRLARCVAAQDYAAAAQERDALAGLELRLRQLELQAAADKCAGVQFSLGVVIKHRRYNYRGVIFGYDPRCLAPEEWIQMMHVDQLPRGRNQPFYHVLVDERDRPGGQTTYVAQENIAPARTAAHVQHPLVAHFFSGFSLDDRQYLPSPVLKAAYPQDF